MNIQIEKVDQLVLEADKIIAKPSGEAVLVKLLELREQIDAAIDAAKVRLEAAALKLNPNFSSIQGEKVKVYYRQYGPRYKIDESLIQFIPTELFTEKKTYTPVPAEIEKWTQKLGGLPQGIIEPDRPKQLTITLKEKESENH